MAELNVLVNSLSRGYLLKQAVVITMLHAVGILFVSACDRSLTLRKWRPLLAYPAGLALFALSSYLMLCLGIPLVPVSVLSVLALVSAVSVICLIKRAKGVDIILLRREIFAGIMSVAVVFLLGIMLTSNPLKVALDNDSLYYFSAYPDAIVREGRYIRYFDVFLTDAAPIGSIIHTLPYLFGFSETFAIQYMMDICFLLIFASALCHETYDTLGRRGAVVCALSATIFLVTSSAYLTTAKWIMSGVYFMSYYFISAYTAYFSAGTDPKARPYPLIALLTVMTAMTRQEGVVLILLLVILLSSLEEYDGKELALVFLTPTFAAAALYYLRVFVILDVRPLYSFLTPFKAVVILLLPAAGAVYCLMIRPNLKDKKLVYIAVPAALILANIGFLVRKPSEYLGDLKMFYLNIRIGAGWGYFGYIAICVFLILVIKAVVRREKEILLFDSLYITYVLAALVVSLGRGDALRKGVGDSGNRVMLTAVPLIVFGMTLRFFAKMGEDK